MLFSKVNLIRIKLKPSIERLKKFTEFENINLIARKSLTTKSAKYHTKSTKKIYPVPSVFSAVKRNYQLSALTESNSKKKSLR